MDREPVPPEVGVIESPPVTASQAELALIPHKVENRIVQQRAVDGYINATAMCKVAGRPWNRYWDTQRTQRFIQALSVDTGIPAIQPDRAVQGPTRSPSGNLGSPPGRHQPSPVAFACTRSSGY